MERKPGEDAKGFNKSRAVAKRGQELTARRRHGIVLLNGTVSIEAGYFLKRWWKRKNLKLTVWNKNIIY